MDDRKMPIRIRFFAYFPVSLGPQAFEFIRISGNQPDP